jgi:phage baseplate assembly protein V
MLRFGIVTNIDESTAKARVKFAEDSLLSYWLPVLQSKTLVDKFYCLPDIGEHVACLMDEKSEDGVILGNIYSKQDKVPVASKDKFHISFEDGTQLEYDKKYHILSAIIIGSANIQVAEILNINAPSIAIRGNVYHEGLFTNTDGINSNGEISDHTSSMQAMREIYNSHKHTGNMGSPTSPPTEVMQ